MYRFGYQSHKNKEQDNMNIETKHKLIDLRSEINKERDTAVETLKAKRREKLEKESTEFKQIVKELKDDYKQVYADRKTELIAENEV
jgi:prefoldin subunit 5